MRHETAQRLTCLAFVAFAVYILVLWLASCRSMTAAPYVQAETFEFDDEWGSGLTVGVQLVPEPEVPAARPFPAPPTPILERPQARDVEPLQPPATPDPAADCDGRIIVLLETILARLDEGEAPSAEDPPPAPPPAWEGWSPEDWVKVLTGGAGVLAVVFGRRWYVKYQERKAKE